MNTWILDTALVRLLSMDAVMLTEPPNSQMVANREAGQTGFEEIHPRCLSSGLLARDYVRLCLHAHPIRQRSLIV
jgi:hypothetical protein